MILSTGVTELRNEETQHHLQRRHPWLWRSKLTAFAVAAIQTRHTPIHLDHGLGAALAAQLGAGRELAAASGAIFRQFCGAFELRFLLFDEFLLVLVQAVVFQQPDHAQVTFDGVTDFGHQ